LELVVAALVNVKSTEKKDLFPKSRTERNLVPPLIKFFRIF
jgi:hypothetical protein